jgi:hypothetical protein
MHIVDRRDFLKRIGLATGTAVIPSAPIVRAAAEPAAVEAAPSRPVPPEPIVAIVRDSELGEVTVVSGMSERTYRDPALVQRLLKAAGRSVGDA